MYTLFYSWQSDLVSKYNRNFIEDCIKKSLKKINKADEITLEVSLDKDTQGESGTPDIVATIFNKIAHSHIFVCDISIINPDGNYRKTPNPNVSIELGYAAAIVGWENIICIFNTAYGKVEDLPFDLRFRRPLQFHYNETSAAKDADVLVNQLENAIKLAHPEVVENKNQIRYEFRHESNKATRIALEKPDYWQLKLAEELFIYKLKSVNQRYEDVDRQLLFKKTVNLTNKEFFKLLPVEMEHLVDSTSGLATIFNEDLNPAMQSDNPIIILDAIRRYFFLIENLLAWEVEIKSWRVGNKFSKARELLLGVTKQLIVATSSLPEQVKRIYQNPFSKELHHIEIVFEEPKKILELQDIINYYNSNLHLLIDDWR